MMTWRADCLKRVRERIEASADGEHPWQADGEFTLRYETLRTVNSECGSAALATVDSFVILTAR